ncbi:MAG: type II toxin-antitoxin system HicA family toxin [Atopobiaceae bacterium]|nr:type II toxin-antitoxin system HicA family toxin [Atopobiaceae bacterium]
MQRRELVKLLLGAGFEMVHGASHDKFSKGDLTVMVKRHKEIEDETAKRILRQAGLR